MNMTKSNLSQLENLEDHVKLICESYARLLKKPLLEIDPKQSLVEQVFDAPFTLLSHGIQDDPIFNFGNRVALKLFELTWDELIALPSRFSAEAPNREERGRLLDRVTRFGFIDDYQGIRVSSTGKRFLIKQATVWNLIDEHGIKHGQAACFSDYKFLS